MKPILWLFLFSSCLRAQAAEPLWVYASVYKEYIQPIETAFEKKHPGIDVQVFQAGSEKIQAKVEAEILSKKIQADVLLISNPFWAADLATRKIIEARSGGPIVEHNYYSLMVLTAHRDVPESERPKSFSDFSKPVFKDKVQIGNPLESGTNFTMIAALTDRFGWDLIQQWATNGIASAGGNSTVIQKIESKEKLFGAALLENILAVQAKGSPIVAIYPQEGGVLIPNDQLLVRGSPHKVAAEQFMQFLVSDEGQRLLAQGYLYPVSDKVAGPKNARSLKDVRAQSIAVTPEMIAKTQPKLREIKQKFTQMVLE